MLKLVAVLFVVACAGLNTNHTTNDLSTEPDGYISLWIVIVVAVGGSIVAVTCVTISLIGCYWLLKEKQPGHTQTVYWKDSKASFENSSVPQVLSSDQKPRKLSRISFTSRSQLQLQNMSCPLSITELGRLIHNTSRIYEQYFTIPGNMTSVNDIPPGSENKNRYLDVLPAPHSRVTLFLKFGIAYSDYINANFIRGYKGQSKAFIATQGPLPHTISDFWRMVWEQKASVIIMTTALVERGIEKCAQYWPNSLGYGVSEIYGELQVTIRKKDKHRYFVVTTFIIQHLERCVTREITHYWFTSWPDHGVPKDCTSVVDFLLETRRNRDSFTIPGPTIVHCSAGIGRTGVFIGADIGMRELEENETVDILKIVSNMRQDRGGMVQTKEQYHFLHKVLLDYAGRLGHVVPQAIVEYTQDEDVLSTSQHDILVPSSFM